MVSICDRVRYVETDMMGVVHCRCGAVGADERQHNFPHYPCGG